MSRITVPSNLPELVKTAFSKAKANGDLTFYPTQATIITINSIPFQLRFSPALASKPKPQKPSTPESSLNASLSPPKPAAAVNPFANPDPALLITHLPAPVSHYLVLNKFAVVPEHFILATTAFAPQTHLLEPADLATARACIDAYNSNTDGDDDNDAGNSDGGRPEVNAGDEQEKNKSNRATRNNRNRLFVFFNSGEHSGASQAHRHLQFLPVERMRDGLPPSHNWAPIADLLYSHPHIASKLPFAHFAERLPPSDQDPSGDALHAAYLRLYQRACASILRPSSSSSFSASSAEEAHEPELQRTGEARISYNMAMTRDTIVMCPRRQEGGPVVRSSGGGLCLDGEGEVVGKLALNGTVLAGTALVRTEAEWDAVRGDPGQLGRVLSKI